MERNKMGEYVNYKNQPVKIGTCENLYYASYEKYVSILQFLKQEENNLPPEDYCKDNSGFRFRFPFPDEDCTQFGNVENYNRGYQFSVPEELAHSIEHREMSVSVNCEGRCNINIQIPCPAGDNLKLKHSRIEFYPMLLKQQKLIDGELQAVFECGYCGAKFRVDLEEAEKYSAFIESEEIKKRIMAGYK